MLRVLQVFKASPVRRAQSVQLGPLAISEPAVRQALRVQSALQVQPVRRVQRVRQALRELQAQLELPVQLALMALRD